MTPNLHEGLNRGRIVACAAAVALISLCFGARAQAQTANVVRASLAPSIVAVRPGAIARVVVVARIASGYHINAHKPTLDYAIPTKLNFEPSSVASLKSAQYPAGKLVKFAFSDKPLSVYEGLFKVSARLMIARRARTGQYRLRGVLHYQACNQVACLPPANAPVSMTLRIVR